MKLVYTVQEAASLLRVNRKTVSRAIDRGQIRAAVIGRERRIGAREMARLLGLDEKEEIDEGQYSQAN